ncbi:GDP-mannose 4,6-dehydratase [Variovorax sp. 770b2]|uniref:GDP-mannose 4,6-dehydratase n=1 Tax=Variovorax sp. 770b2 TaxID=1566271 RepID=UPI0008E64166|nr:GDP-mannose 4,6-dehydratase [Variovorax sp. 770b2]SFQ25937.1 UDP-glucose 4-epimerase [Variovorax sp. 770b2]
MKILLTGAQGFTGRVFASRAAEAGHEIAPLLADLTDGKALRREIGAESYDAVVHLAAISFVGHADERAFYDVNVIGTTNLLDALLELTAPPTRILLASSANVYGNSNESPLTELHPPAPVNHYATSKLAMEHMARTYNDRLDIVVTRPFNYTGPGQDANFVIPKLAKHFAERAKSIALGNLDVEREFNDVRMVCDAYLMLLDHGKAGEIYNVCSGQPYMLQHVIDVFTRLSGHKIQVQLNPKYVRPNEVHRLCGSPEKLSTMLAEHGLSLEPPPLEETLQRMLDSYSST